MTIYTPEQAAQMRKDTRLYQAEEQGNGRDVAIVFGPSVDEMDDAFFTDIEWLRWFWDAFPDWAVVDMNDSPMDGLSWVVRIERRPKGDQ